MYDKLLLDQVLLCGMLDMRRLYSDCEIQTRGARGQFTTYDVSRSKMIAMDRNTQKVHITQSRSSVPGGITLRVQGRLRGTSRTRWEDAAQKESRRGEARVLG